MKNLLRLGVLLFLLMNTTGTMAQLGIGTTTPDASSILDLTTTSKGMLVPRMTLAQKTAVATPATGLLIYQTDGAAGFWYYTGTAWVPFITSSTGWLTTGNIGTVDATHFLGTTDNIPLNFRVNNQKSGRIDHINANAFFGYQAGYSNTTGALNTFIGQRAGYSNTTGIINTFVGDSSGFSNTTGIKNTAFGYRSLQANTSGNWNNSIGYKTLIANTTGGDNDALGYAALFSNTTGNNNVAVGNYALQSNTTASDNTAVGYGALISNSTGSQNAAGGYQSMYLNTTGIMNTAFGDASLYTNSIGDYNTAIGTSALAVNTTGDNNTALGYYAGNSNTTGANNTFLGFGADATSAALTNATAIGYNAKVAANNSLVLGGTGTYAVNVGIGTTTPARMLDVNGNARIGINGTTLANVIKATVTKDLGVLAAYSGTTETFAVTNAALTSSVMISPATTLPTGITICYARVSIAGTVEVKFFNATGAAIDPASMNFYITVVE